MLFFIITWLQALELYWSNYHECLSVLPSAATYTEMLRFPLHLRLRARPLILFLGF